MGRSLTHVGAARAVLPPRRVKPDAVGEASVMKVRFDFGARTVLTQSSYEDNEFLAQAGAVGSVCRHRCVFFSTTTVFLLVLNKL